MGDYQHYQVLTTVDSRSAAETLSHRAVEARVAACGQILGPIKSTYWWEGKVESGEEWYVVFKTAAERYPALENFIRDNHSYEVPEILATPIIAGNPEYLAWLTAETGVHQLGTGE